MVGWVRWVGKCRGKAQEKKSGLPCVGHTLDQVTLVPPAVVGVGTASPRGTAMEGLGGPIAPVSAVASRLGKQEGSMLIRRSVLPHVPVTHRDDVLSNREFCVPPSSPSQTPTSRCGNPVTHQGHSLLPSCCSAVPRTLSHLCGQAGPPAGPHSSGKMGKWPTSVFHWNESGLAAREAGMGGCPGAHSRPTEGSWAACPALLQLWADATFPAMASRLASGPRPRGSPSWNVLERVRRLLTSWSHAQCLP